MTREEIEKAAVLVVKGWPEHSEQVLTNFAIEQVNKALDEAIATHESFGPDEDSYIVPAILNLKIKE